MQHRMAAPTPDGTLTWRHTSGTIQLVSILNGRWIYGIQMMPISPVSELLLRPQWVHHSRHVWEAAMYSAADEWRAFLVMATAVLDSQGGARTEQLP